MLKLRFVLFASLSLVILAGVFTPRGSVFANTDITGNITADTTWTTAGSIYVIQNSISINSGVTLTIEPGVVVKFRYSSTVLTVNGTLNAEGAATSSIYFTSYKDDTAGGDTNGDGSATSPSEGNWRQIVVGASGATVNLDYAVVRYGGSSYNYMLYNNGGTLNVENSVIASSTRYGFVHNAGTSTIATGIFNGNGYYGIYGTGTGSLSVTDSNFYNNATAAGYFGFDGGLTLANSGNSASGTGKRGFIVSGSIGANQTWQADDVPYIVSSAGITVPSGKTLTVNPGAVIKFENTSAYLTVNGILDAEGTINDNIYFTSIKDNQLNDTDGTDTAPQAGNWGHITTGSNATTTLKYVTVQYGGYAYDYMLYNNGGKLDVRNSLVASSTKYGIRHGDGNTDIATSTFGGNGYYGLYSYPSSGNISVTGSTFYDNATAAGYFGFGSGLTLTNSGNTNSATGSGKRGFIMTGGTSAHTTWQADGLPYIISGGFTVNSGNTLTINLGSVVKFENSSAYMQVSGTLNAIGISTYPIYFTSIKDDTVGNDTDATSTSPTAGDWKYITVPSNATANFYYATVRYGGGDGYYAANLLNGGGTFNISSSTISNGYSYGIRHGGGTTNLTQSSLFGNGTEAYYNTTYSTTTATNNYWGDVSGPYNAKYNPSGTGNAVSDYVNFNPWLGQTHYIWPGDGSVDWDEEDGNEIRWGGTTQYSNAWENAVDVWNALRISTTSGVLISPDDILHYEDVTVSDVYDSDVDWSAQYEDYPILTDDIFLNEFFLQNNNDTQRQNTCTHELGHALKLGHSYLNNVMYFQQTNQTELGIQDVGDYNSLWE
jgi:hypothetical protein